MKIRVSAFPGRPDGGGQSRIVLTTIDLFGVDRCMFASNFPGRRAVRADFGAIYRGFEKIVRDFSAEERRAPFVDNASTALRCDTGLTFDQVNGATERPLTLCFHQAGNEAGALGVRRNWRDKRRR